MKALGALEALARANPAKARETLAAIIERIVLTPTKDGYRARLTMKSNPAAVLRTSRHPRLAGDSDGATLP